MIEDCDLHKIDFVGYPFTWERRFSSDDRVEEKLDRGFGNSLWCQHFSEAKIFNLSATLSNHSPLFLQIVKNIF